MDFGFGTGTQAYWERYDRSTSSKRQNIEFVLAWLDAVVRGDEEALAAALQPDAVWQGIQPEWRCDGAPEVIDTFMAARATQADIDSIELIGAQQHVIMRVRWPQILDDPDAGFLDGIYTVFAIAVGRITRIDDYEDRAAALAAAGLADDAGDH